MNTHDVSSRIAAIGIIPSVRVSSAAEAHFAAEALSAAGIAIVEIAIGPGAPEVIAGLVRSFPDLVVGADVVTLEMARRSIDAGAQFVTSPGFDARMVALAGSAGVLAIAGALTPTEVLAARAAGADFVKVFPCVPLGGAAYLHALKAPFHDVPLIAAGGVNEQTAGALIGAGAIAIGVGAALLPQKAIRQRQADWIAELARRFLSIVREAREARVRRGKTPASMVAGAAIPPLVTELRRVPAVNEPD
jgi:2-dehydro-3-deoxyphosphogluconate aldolase/(4S)-4-hydroxy-2-oxoglutarate aldolase